MKPEPMPLNGVDGFCRPRCAGMPGMPRKNLKNGSSSMPWRQALLSSSDRLVHAFDGDADDGRRRLLDDGAVVRHLAGRGARAAPAARRVVGAAAARLARPRPGVVALEPVRQVERAGGADDGDAGADEGRAQGFQFHGRLQLR